MSNKNSLQTNNNKLINIKKVIEDLPITDNIDTGLYIWEKSMIIKSPVTITADNSPNQDGITIKIKVRTSDISLSDLTKADFVGVTIARSGVGYPKIEFISETECITTGSSGVQPYTEEWSWNGNNSSYVNILVYGGSTVAWFEEKFNLERLKKPMKQSVNQVNRHKRLQSKKSTAFLSGKGKLRDFGGGSHSEKREWEVRGKNNYDDIYNDIGDGFYVKI